MEVKAYFNDNTNFIIIEINGKKMEIDLETAIDRYCKYEIVTREIEKACLNGDDYSKQIWEKWEKFIKRMYEHIEEEEELIDNIELGKEKLGEILSSIDDKKVKEQIENVLEEYKRKYNEDIRYLSRGGSSTVFTIGDKVIKFGTNPMAENVPLTLKPHEKVQYEKYSSMRIFEKLQTGNITQSDLQYVYNTLREQGYVWNDVKEDNLGRVIDESGNIKEIRIIDDIDIWREEDILNDSYISVLEFFTDINNALFEIEYQKQTNPEFDINNLGQYFRKYEYSLEKQIYVSVLEIESFMKQNKEKQYLVKNEILILMQAIENGEIETIISYIDDEKLKHEIQKIYDENRFREEQDNIEKEYLSNIASQIKKEDYQFLKDRINSRASMCLICAIGDTKFIKECLNDENLQLDLIKKVFLISATNDSKLIKQFLINNISELESWQKTKLITSTNDVDFMKDCINNNLLQLEDNNKAEIIIATKDSEYIKEFIESCSLDKQATIDLIKSTKDSKYIKSKIEDSDLEMSNRDIVSLLTVSNDKELIKYYLDSNKLEINDKLEMIRYVKDKEYIKQFISKNNSIIEKTSLMSLIAQTKDSDYIYKFINSEQVQLSDKEKTKIILQTKDEDLIEEYYEEAENLSDKEKAIFEFIINPNYLETELEGIKKIELPKGMTIGVEIETEGDYSEQLPKSILYGRWKSKTDNSLENGVEIVSTILSGSEQDSKEIYQICDLLQKIGQDTSERCGAHVHIGADYLTSKQAYFNLLEIFGNAEEIIYAISNGSNSNIRKGISKYCLPIASKLEKEFESGSIDEEKDLDAFIEQLQIVQGDRYSGINFMNIGTSKNTIEFRTSNGTINPNEWIENINLFGGIINAAQELSIIQQKKIYDLTQEDKEKLMHFSKLKSQDIHSKEKLDALLSLSVSDKETYIERYNSNIELIEQDTEIKETMQKTKLKKPLNIRNMAKNLFAGTDGIRGEEVTKIEEVFFRDIAKTKEGEKSYE